MIVELGEPSMIGVPGVVTVPGLPGLVGGTEHRVSGPGTEFRVPVPSTGSRCDGHVQRTLVGRPVTNEPTLS